MELLFVCTGNICRSPTAERLSRRYAEDLGLVDIQVSSAGTRAVISHPIHDNAAAVLENLGGDASNFEARQLTPRIANSANLIITMERSHRDKVLEMAPRQLRRTFTLTEISSFLEGASPRSVDELAALRASFATNSLTDVPDPIGQTPEVFTTVGSQIAALVPPVVEFCGRASGSLAQR